MSVCARACARIRPNSPPLGKVGTCFAQVGLKVPTPGQGEDLVCATGFDTHHPWARWGLCLRHRSAQSPLLGKVPIWVQTWLTWLFLRLWPGVRATSPSPASSTSCMCTYSFYCPLSSQRLIRFMARDHQTIFGVGKPKWTLDVSVTRLEDAQPCILSFAPMKTGNNATDIGFHNLAAAIGHHAGATNVAGNSRKGICVASHVPSLSGWERWLRSRWHTPASIWDDNS